MAQHFASQLKASFFVLLVLFMSMSNAAWGDTWDGTVGNKPSTGAGTAASPYEIGDARTFVWFMKQVSGGLAASASKTYGNKYWKLTADIDLNNLEWNAYGSSQSAFLGHFDGGGHTISNMSLAPSSRKTQHGLFGNISGTSKTVRSEVKNLTIASSSFNPTTNLTGRSCGFLCGYSRYADITNVTVTGCAFNMGTYVFGTGASYVGGVVGQGNLSVTVRNCTVSGFTFSCSANMTKLSLGGIAGYCNASSATPFTIEGCSVNTPTFTIGTTANNQLNGCNIGGFLGSGATGLNIYDNKVTTPQMTIYAKVTGSSYIAGGIGTTGSYSNIDGIHISGGYIKDALASGASDFIPITAGTEFVVAGAIAKVTNGGTGSGTANVVKNVAVTGMKFDLPHHNVATGVTNTNKFVVGAVMGYISSPSVDASGRCAIPENIVSKGVTLYAPYAITSAVVGTSGTPAGIDNYHDDGRGGLDQIRKSQHDTWFYSDYKLGLSSDVLTNSNIIEWGAATEQTAKVERNYLSSSVETNTDASISAPKLLNLTGTTFQHKPGYSDHEFDGGTVLWWNQASGTANDNTQQAFYPLDGTTGRICTASCGAGGTHPYFMYFFQGVNHGTYVEPVAADNIIAGIDANYTLMTANTALTTPTVLTISDPDGTAKKRGFDAHVISVSANGEELTDNNVATYTYKWYVNGVEQSETGTSISVKPDWRYSKSIQVNAVSGDQVVGSASYTLRHGVLKTKNFEDTETDYVGMSYAERGTSDNPYIIDCPEALKQWSYLSTYCTAYNYEGTQSGATVAFNQSYFELAADIDLGIGTTDEERAANPGELIPIGHCGFSQDGTRGTINQNFVFCGHFEGNGHTIKNFKIKWKGATINSGGKYIYFGLFGALGWGESAATQSCVVQNLILENGHIVHDNTNRSLYYEGTTHSNNVCIGVLAGIASQYTTVRNVELRNCAIDDNEDTEDYYLAGAQLTVGGMIGRIQGAITANNMDFGSTIVTNFLSSNCDITLKHAAYGNKSTASETSFAEYSTNSLVRLYTVGGVIGSIYSASAAFSTVNMPKYIYYTGKIDARRAFVAPGFASADYSGITGNNYEDYWKHFMVNATENATQEIPNLYYGKFQIQDYTSSDEGTTQTINNTYPATTCSADGGSRTIVAHNNAHPNNYNFYTDNNKYYGAYQGVNYGTLVGSGDRAALELEIAAAKNSFEEISSWYLVFDDDKLILTDHMPEKLSLQDLVSGNTHTVTVINTAADADDYTYEWYINGVKSSEIATTTRSVDFTTDGTPKLIYVKAIKDGNEKKTDFVTIPRNITSITASYTPVREIDVEGGRDNFDGHFTVTPDDDALAAYGADDGKNIAYVWKQFRNAYQETLEYTEETAWAANKQHIISFKVSSTGADVAKADWTYAKSVSSDYTVEYGDIVTRLITEEDYTALGATEQAKCTANGDGTYSYTYVDNSYTPVTVGQEYTVYHTGEYVDITDGTTYNDSGTSSTTTGADVAKTYQCTVTATDDAWVTFLAATDRTSQYSDEVIADATRDYPTSFTYSLAVRLKKNIVVWLHPVERDTTVNGVTILAGKDKWTSAELEGGEVGDQKHPVRTWGKAYSLLDGAEGVDWDFNKIVLVGTSDALTTNGFGASPGEGEHGNGTGKEYSLGEVSWYGLSNVFSEGTNGLQKTESAPSYDEYMAKIALSPMAKNVTITGKYDGVDYGGAITSPQIESYDKTICGNDYGKPVQRWFNMLGDTKFEYLTFIGCADASYDSFFGHYHDIWFGEGLIMKRFCGDSSGYGTIATISTPRFDIWGGIHNDERFSLYDGKNGELLRMQEKFMPHGKKGFTMTFRSGYYSIICTGSRETESVGIQGSPEMPIKCTVDVDLDQDWNNQGENPKTMANATSTPYDVGIILSGNHEGPMFADIDISVKSGRVARVVNGSLGANTPSQYIYGNGKLSYPYNNFMGRTNMVLEPAKSRFATDGEDAETTNARVLVTEMYNGSIGRSWADNKQEIDMASLGHFNITMNGGTIGFPHTTTYWTDTNLATLKASQQVYCGIYGGGAGGMIGIGYGDYDSSDAAFIKPHSYTKEKFLPYWDSKDHVCPYYSPYSIYKKYIAKDDPQHLFIHCYNAATDDYTEVDPADTKSVITINGGVIGSAEKPANIFGAGSGFTSTWFLRQSNYPNLTSGAVYGTSNEDTVCTVNIKGNTVIYGNVYGAGKGTDYYYTHYYTSTSVFSGNTETAKLFTKLGQTYGSVKTNISGNAVINGNVYGGGAGVAEAKFIGSTDLYAQMDSAAYLSGNTFVNISGEAKVQHYTYEGETYGGNVYGGGMLALVGGNTNVNISGKALISGSVFGAAQGITKKTNELDSPQTIPGTMETYNLYSESNARQFGIVDGDANLTIDGSSVIGGDLYGGAESAIVIGNTKVSVTGGTINDVYGGGLGSVDTDGTTVTAYADVKGQTTVTVKKASYSTADSESYKKHYIYGGGNLACSVGIRTLVNVNHGIDTGLTSVFGGGYGVNTSCNSTEVNITNFLANDEGDVKLYGLADVYGGGNQGAVSHKAVVSISKGIVLGNVFGGGNEATVGTPASSAIVVDGITVDQTRPGVARYKWSQANGTSVSIVDSKAYVYGNVYGGGNMADVYGNTYVKLENGYFGGDVFGGGNGKLYTAEDEATNSAFKANTPNHYANVSNNSSVDVRGATALWNAKWDSDTHEIISWDGTWNGANRTQFMSGTTEDSLVFLTSHNIYGGGNKACIIADTASVDVLCGFVNSDLISGKIWKDTFDDNAHPHFYVFGGGYGAFTSVENTDVSMNVYFYNEGSIYSLTDAQLAKRRVSAGELGIGVYDNSYGVPYATVLGLVGGGYAGLVRGNANVNFGGKSYTHRIYGGGYGLFDSFSGLYNANPKVGSLPNIVSDERNLRDVLGEVGDSTSVNIYGGNVYGDVFGGGAGVKSRYIQVDNDNNVVIKDGNVVSIDLVDGNGAGGSGAGGNGAGSAPKGYVLTDFADMARVHAATAVTVSDEANIYGNVYGGGDIANVGVSGTTKDYTLQPTIDDSNLSAVTADNAATFVNIIGGSVYGAAFAGGNGQLKSASADYTKLGRIEGNTLLHVANQAFNSVGECVKADASDIVSVNEPYVWNRIYGGGNYGTVDGNTKVWIEGGHIGYNIFGGGNGDEGCTKDANGNVTATDGDQPSTEVAAQKGTYANVLGNTNIQIDGGSIIWDQYADADGNIYQWENADLNLGYGEVDGQEVDSCFIWKAAGILKDKFKAIGINENFYNIDGAQFPINHNIYGGGRYACIVGTYTNGTGKTEDMTAPDANTGNTTVTLNHSMVTDANLLDTETLAGACWYSIIDNTAAPQFAVFGGGYGANTKVGNTAISSQMGVLNAYGTGDEDGSASKPYKNYALYDKDLSVWNNYEQDYYDYWKTLSSETKTTLYGGTNATDVIMYRRYRASRYAWSSGIPSATYLNYFGGGFSGYVTGNTSVTFTGHSAARHIYGGGLGAVTGRSVRSISQKSIGSSSTFGQVGGNTNVDVEACVVSANVFGGGGGVESKYVGADGSILSIDQVDGNGAENGAGGNGAGNGADGYTLTDYTNMARVLGNTSVTVNGTFVKHTYSDSKTLALDNSLVLGHVYGGGDVANVLGGNLQDDGTPNKPAATDMTAKDGEGNLVAPVATYINVKGGNVFSEINGGGNGRTNAECKDYTTLGAVYGNTHVVIGSVGQDQTYAPWLLNRIFGAGENGTVYGNTLVDINSGHLENDIYGGGWGNVDSTAVKAGTATTPTLTSADVTGNTYINVNGGEAILAQVWEAGTTRAWLPLNKVGINTYSSQYNPTTKKFLIDHNIYGGGNTVCVVGGNTHVNVVRGLLNEATDVNHSVTGNNFFLSDEWKEIYDKVASPHFSVFGAGYGENTVVKNNTYVSVNMPDDVELSADDHKANSSDYYKIFKSNQSVMDVLGGGYEGKVDSATYVTIGGSTYARRVFGGGFYAPVGSAHVSINSINCDDVFGGGLMGDIGKSGATADELKRGICNDIVNIGTADGDNTKLFINNSVYGGNDVSGNIYGTATLNVYGGTVYGNIYGAGNGNYLYAQGVNGETKIMINEYYKTAASTYDLVYTVPTRSFMASVKNSSAAQRMVNINSYRPQLQNVRLNLGGSTNGSVLNVNGSVFGGGNSATVNEVTSGQKPTCEITFNSNLNIGSVYLGCDGDAMFDNTNKFLEGFQDVNDIDISSEIDWHNDPMNIAIPEQYLPVSATNRSTIYPHYLDLYFEPVEMSIQPKVNWVDGMSNVVIGSFICGGNRGNMNVEPDADGKILDIEFPTGLTITDKIVGGCNNANYTLFDGTFHEGGYLLGSSLADKAALNLLVNCSFNPNGKTSGHLSGGNVYGGCYKSGTIRGNVSLDVRSNMLANVLEEDYEDSKAVDGVSLCNVYGAGYGNNSYVYGKVNIALGKDTKADAAPAKSRNADVQRRANYVVTSGSSANYIFGGGQQGNLIGNSIIHVYNGHVKSSVCGGSYAGYMWGSTNVLIGYPTYYTVKSTGIYNLKRTDKWNSTGTAAVKNYDGTEVVKTSIHLIEGDIVSEEVYDAIASFDGTPADGTTVFDAASFTKTVMTPDDVSLTWDDVSITVDDALYGGGYSLASGSSVAAGSYTVKKYDSDYNLDGDLGYNTQEYGGNTTVLVWDAPTANTSFTTDHVTVSALTMTKVTLADGADLSGYYYLDNDGNYRYVYQAEKYYYGDGYAKPGDQSDTDKNFYSNDAEGGIYGDGHYSFAEGFRCGEMNGYGFAEKSPAGPRLINTFQRMDLLRLTDCCISLLGAVDYTSAQISTVPYSIARIGEIQMMAKNIIDTDNNKLTSSTGTLAAKTAKRSRNYLAFNNNIHYCGAVYSNVAFTDDYRDRTGATVTDNPTYRERKQSVIDSYTGSDMGTDAGLSFQKRNDGTAANCIGIASGYALKLQNIYTDKDANNQVFYGPIVGVAEIELINIQEGEGGGYVYADNIHHRTTAGDNAEVVPLETATGVDEDFLETTGNFVFPFDSKNPRWVVDDCFPTEYFTHVNDATKGAADNTIETGIHYWYVTGFDYYFSSQITGYTYNTSNSPLTFVSKTSDEVVQFTGLKKGQEVNLRRLRWHSGHSASDGFIACDLETAGDDSHGNNVQNADAATTGHYTYDHYNLSMTTEDGASWNNLPLTANLDNDKNRTLSSALTSNAPSLNFQLVDAADNLGADYYTKYMAQPCKGTLMFSAPAMKNGVQQTDQMPITQFYTRTGDSEDNYVYTAVTDGTLDKSADYYYMDNLDGYVKVDFNNIYTRSVDDLTDKVSYTQVTGDVNADASYYTLQPRYYTYTIYLTIDYVQGPSATGGIKIYNCALPGEMIKIDCGDIEVHSDKSMNQVATYWRFGKRTKGDNGLWTLPSAKYSSTNESGYYEYYQANPNTWSASNFIIKGNTVIDNNVTSKMLKDVYYDADGNYILVPAYYFMNGYGVQYCYKVNGIDEIFGVDMNDADTLTVHNYHRMQPRKASGDALALDLHVDLAAQRHKAEMVAANSETDPVKKAAALAAVLPEPRVYIEDEKDMYAFAECMKDKDTSDDPLLGSTPDNGSSMQFFLKKDLALSGYTSPAVFRGKFHGNGHVITGLSNKHLFDSLGDSVDVYNLGLATGLITDGDSKGKKNSKYHCCYTYNNSTVYRMDGSATSGYSSNDWRYGKVAYDLNQYYLDKRYHVGGGNASDPQTYVESLYANGDYLYSDFSADNHYMGSEFLRTASRPNYLSLDLASDGSADTWHDKTHTVDVTRAVGYKAATDAVLYADATEYNTDKGTSLDADAFAALTDEEKIKTPAVAASCTGYQPLFEASKISSSVSDDQVVGIKNDYVFFGQLLNSTTRTVTGTNNMINNALPDVITTNLEATTNNLVTDMTNRVYRAGGYYKSGNDNGYYYNTDAYVHNNYITAIDFYGYGTGDGNYDTNTAIGGAIAASTKGGLDFYAPTVDYPSVGLFSMSINGSVTRNLIVYAHNEESYATGGALETYLYTDKTSENNIKAHVIKPVTGADGTTEYLHLVERTSNNVNSVGGSCKNNNFYCPFKFTVTKQAWYVRKPLYYAETSNSAWEGLCLPFDVNKVSASYNGEISHFYGATEGPSANAGSSVVSGNTGHEYWLRGLVSVSQADGTTTAAFTRPGSTAGLFSTASNLTGNYTYTNTHFKDVYGDIYESGDIYASPRTYNSYYFQNSNVPYIVSFPGSVYREFDLSGQFNASLMASGHTYNWDADDTDGTHQFSKGSLPTTAQTVTFAWICSEEGDRLASDASAQAVNGTITIPASGDMTGTTIGDYTHNGTYLALTLSSGSYGMTTSGNAFDDAQTSVLPFRTYMTAQSSGAKTRTISIGGETSIGDVAEEEPLDPGLYIYSKDQCIVVESTYDITLNVYNAAGQLVKVLDVFPGTTTFPGFAQGVYIVGNHKLVVK